MSKYITTAIFACLIGIKCFKGYIIHINCISDDKLKENFAWRERIIALYAGLSPSKKLGYICFNKSPLKL